MSDSVFRTIMKDKLRTLAMTGEILDLGGARGADYHDFATNNALITIVNINPDTKPDIIHDLEKTPIPVADASFNGVFAINVLEHIYNHGALLRESFRVLKSQGTVVVIVPFVHYVHGAPSDYFRYTKDGLTRLLTDAGFKEIAVEEIGSGVFTATLNLFSRFLPSFILWPLFYIARFKDGLLRSLARLLGKQYSGAEYPMGYFVKAIK